MNKVLEPIKLGNVEVKNRLMYLAMGKMFSDMGGFVSRRDLAYYGNLAAGGTGLIVPGCMVVDKDWPSTFPTQPGLYDDKFLPGLTQLVEVIHEHGAKAFFQLWHPGKCDYTGRGTRYVHELSVDEIHDIQKKFVDAAVRAKKAGADGVEFQVCHTYLAEQFLTPKFNERTDEYSAAPLENGMRFTLEVLRGIQEACGADYPIISKLNGDAGIPDGMKIELAVEVAKRLESAGVCMISVSGGGKLGNMLYMSADGNSEEGWKVPFAEAVKAAVKIPVCATGSIRRPAFVNEILEAGKCDMVGLGRGLLAEPEFIKKLEEGREDEVKCCISCMSCFLPKGPDEYGCSVNPTAGREWRCYKQPVNGGGRKVVVIGGGPAGCEAALELAKREFDVTLFESGSKLGGMANLAAAPKGKYKVNWLIEYFERVLPKYGVDVRLNTPATEAELAKLAPMAVFVGAGSFPIIPKNLPGVDLPHVHGVRNVLQDFPAFTGKKVAVIGAGLTGLETAETFAAAGNQVTVLDMIERTEPTYEGSLACNYCLASGVTIKLSHKVEKITETQVIAKDLTAGKDVAIDADYVVLSVGLRPNRELYANIKHRYELVDLIGDAEQNGPSTIRHAMGQAYDAVRLFAAPFPTGTTPQEVKEREERLAAKKQ